MHFDLRAVVEEVGARVRPSAQGKGLSFDARFSPDAPRSLFGDPKRIRQVLMNLASNAVKFTERGRILLRVDDIDSKGDEAHLKISVTDTGPGVPRQAVGAFFDTFSQVEPSTERKLCGSGLSLTLSKQLIELMGGEIGVETGEGVGSTFWFTIRLPARQAARVPTGGYAGTRVLILKAEEEATRELINLMYRWSLSVSEADSVESAANLLRSASGTGRRFQILIVQDDDRVAADALRPVCAEVNAAIVIVSDAKADLAPDVHYLVPPVEHSRLLDMIATVWETLEGHDPPAIPAPSAEPDSSDPQHQGVDSTAERGRARDEEEETLTRVLVVEDNLVNQKVAAGMLSRLGCRPTIAEHGLDALDWLERATFDLIFMDCQMPQMDGYRATQEIRRRENEGLWAHWHDHIPIVAMTANAMNGDREKCLEVDMDDYLSKPANSDQLQGMLERWARPELPVGEPLALALDPAPLEGFDSPVSLEAVETLREVVQDGFSEIVAHFIEDAEQHMVNMKHAVDNSSHEELWSISHQLKSTSGSLGAHHLATLAREAEALGRAEKSPQAAALVANISQEFERVKSALQYLASQPASKPLERRIA